MTPSNTLLSLLRSRRRGITLFNTPIPKILPPYGTQHLKYLTKWIDHICATQPETSIPHQTAIQILDALRPLQQAAPNGLWTWFHDQQYLDNSLYLQHLGDFLHLLIRISHTIQHLRKQKTPASYNPTALQDRIDELNYAITQLLQPHKTPKRPIVHPEHQSYTW